MRSFSKGSGRLSAELADLKSPVPVEVEYVPAHPSVNRLKGEGSQSFAGWFLRTGLSGLLLVLFLAPGVKLIRDGLTTLRASSPASSNPPQLLL